MELLFYTEVEAWMGPELVRTYYFSDDTKAAAELWQLDIPEDDPIYETYQDYTYVWDIFLEVPTENENVCVRKPIGNIAVKADTRSDCSQVNDEIVEAIKEFCERELVG